VSHRTPHPSHPHRRARGLFLPVAVVFGLLALPAVAGAHPLGNFSVNHLTEVSVSADRVDVRYVLDQAEIPTFQERDLGDAAVLARKRAEVSKRLVVTVDGRRVALRPRGRGGGARGARRAGRSSPTRPARAGCAPLASSCR
jgi:hypothetical protein